MKQADWPEHAREFARYRRRGGRQCSFGMLEGVVAEEPTDRWAELAPACVERHYGSLRGWVRG